METQDWAESLCYHVAKDALDAAKQAAQQPAGDEAEFGRKKAVATVIVFSAVCLESFINRQYFEQRPQIPTRHMSLQHKWEELPKLLKPSGSGFNVKAEPFTTFEELVFFRNERLVHFKPEQESSSSIPANCNDWAEDIGDVRLAERYFRCVRAMVEALHLLTDKQTSPPTILDRKYVRTVTASFDVNY